MGSVVKIIAAYSILSIVSYVMLISVAGYTSFNDQEQFLIYKQAYLGNPVWKTAFYIHVFSAILALFAGFTQFSPAFMQQYRRLHRLLGKIYIFDILIVNFPTAMIMAIYAYGGWAGKMAFIVLDILWFVFTAKAYISIARDKNIIEHRKYMIRSYAMTFSAITLRLWKMILTHHFALEYDERYVLEAWLGFVPNLIVAEWCVRTQLSAKLSTR